MLLQVLLTGKICQAAVLSYAAYESEETFRQITGINKCRLIVDKNDRNTHVRHAYAWESNALLQYDIPEGSKDCVF